MGQLDLFVPDRFDVLKRRAGAQLKTIIAPVQSSLQVMDRMYADLSAAGRGGFLIVRGDSGSGKSTFLHTLDLFRENTCTYSVEKTSKLEFALAQTNPSAEDFRVLVIEGREALRDVSRETLEAAIHAVNGFLRAAAGERTLVVWPCNTDDLRDSLVDIARRVGGDALLGTGSPAYAFSGPNKSQYLDIARRTVATLNQGASLHDLGVSDGRANQLAASSATIGAYLNALRQDLLQNKENVSKLLAKEQCRVWVVVIAGNDPDNDVAALTRGDAATADIDRLISATKANVVADLKRFPDQLGILGAVLDARILHLPVGVALSIARLYADDVLKAQMRQRALTLRTAGDSATRLRSSELGRAFSGKPSGTRTRGPKIGSNTRDAFQKLVEIAASNDVLLNRTIGEGLKELALISDYRTEEDLRGRLARRTDLYCSTATNPVRLEIMWRSRTGRADIANYTLSKMGNYARAIGLLT